MAAISVLLIDASAIFLETAREFLEAEAGLTVVGALGSLTTALRRLPTLAPEVVLVDLGMPSSGGIEAIRRLRAAQPGLGIIALTLLDSAAYQRVAIAAGADELISKGVLLTELVPAIHRVAARRGAAGSTDQG